MIARPGAMGPSRSPGARSRTAGVLALVALLVALALPAPAAAATRDTKLTLVAPSEITLGDRVEVQAIVMDGAGKPVRDALVFFSVDKTFEGRTRTDKTGTGRFSVKRDLKVGGHTLTLSYAGDPKHRAAKVSRKLLVNAPSLVIRTLPPLPSPIRPAVIISACSMKSLNTSACAWSWRRARIRRPSNAPRASACTWCRPTRRRFASSTASPPRPPTALDTEATHDAGRCHA